MPEGPEVTVISNGLNKILKGQYLHNLDFNYKGARYSKKNPDKLSEFEQLLPLKINSIESKGKFIYFCFDKDWYMYNTLGMSGGWYKKTKKTMSSRKQDRRCIVGILIINANKSSIKVFNARYIKNFQGRCATLFNL